MNVNELNKNNKNNEYYVKCLDFYAHLLDRTKCENPSVIIRDCLEIVINEVNSKRLNSSIATDAYFSLAKFADLQFQNICDYMKSSTFDQKQDLIKKFRAEAKLVETTEPNSRCYMILRKQIDMNEREVKVLYDDRDEYLCKAIENYLHCLELGDDHDMRIFRLISLWTQNMANLGVNNIMKARVFRICTYKFLPLMYQLAARMSIKHIKTTESISDGEKLFYETLLQLIYTCAKDHPYHVLPIISALSNAYKDEQYLNPIAQPSGKRTKKGDPKTVNNNENCVIGEERIAAGRKIIDQLKSDHPEFVKSIETLFDAYIELANLNVEQYKTKKDPIPLSKSLALTQIKNLKTVPVITSTIPVKKDTDYSSVVTIVKYESTFSLAGGINLPKIVQVLGSDGYIRKELVKGKDDLRQDAVLQQMFVMVNDLLKKNVQTNERNLRIRSYKIVPLSQKSGIIEWCDGTIPFGQWLVGDSGGAHKKYNPTDWLFLDCRKKLYYLDSNSKKTEYEVYMDICDNFKPVFRHFFMEHYLDPYDWYLKRITYTRSVAASSIIGYIIGLGDRHVQNILIDKKTAEVIHIDLGIAFDQGKMLPKPETIPFRLTRDIVDGFGVCGVDGVFTSCCELTLQLMQNSIEEIITIFEVLLYDPIHNWSLSPNKAYRLQQRKNAEMNQVDPENINASLNTLNENTVLTSSNSSPGANTDTNKIAEGILFRLRQKLQGYENNVQMSCKGQVNFLIQEAMNPRNLAKLYAGWQPYL